MKDFERYRTVLLDKNQITGFEEKNIDGYLSDTYFIDIGIPEDCNKEQKELPNLIEIGRV